MKPPMTDNIESLIEDLFSENLHVTLVVEITDRKDNPDEKFVAFISFRDDKYDMILDRSGERFLRAYGPSFNSAVNKLNDRCA